MQDERKTAEPADKLLQKGYNFPSLTVARRKNRCIPCVYWATVIFAVVTESSNLFFPFTFFLNGSHTAFAYKLIIRSETTGLMEGICDPVPFI